MQSFNSACGMKYGNARAGMTACFGIMVMHILHLHTAQTTESPGLREDLWWIYLFSILSMGGKAGMIYGRTFLPSLVVVVRVAGLIYSSWVTFTQSVKLTTVFTKRCDSLIVLFKLFVYTKKA